LQSISAEERRRLLRSSRSEVIHLEMRDVYATDVEKDRFATWRRGEPLDPEAEAEWWAPWFQIMAELKARDTPLRRLRIISEPVTDYIRFEWIDAAQLVRAGEDVRWLPRRTASALLLPGNDFWAYDRHTVVFTHFSGDGHVLDLEMTTDPAIIAACVSSFEEAWKVAIPHSEYRPS
jgi:hypothetical protein